MAVHRATQVAAIGLATTTGTPPLIFEAVICLLDDNQIIGGPFCYWIAPEAPLSHMPISAWPKVRLAPPWHDVAERITEVIGARTVAVLDHDRLNTLRRHLPDWQPTRTQFAQELDTAGNVFAGMPAARTATDEALAIAKALGVPVHEPPGRRRAGPVRAGADP